VARHLDLTLDTDIFNLGLANTVQRVGMAAALRTGLQYSYLMHQLLAVSACRLSFMYRDRYAFYHHQAITLQMQGVAIFNTSGTHVDSTNCAAVLLYTTILGHHMLADTLSCREEGGLDPFLEQYLRCLETQRRVFGIARSSWPLLLETELEPVLLTSQQFTQRLGRGGHCDPIRELTRNASTLTQEEKDAMFTAIRYLQLGFDAEVDAEIEPGYRFQMIYLWTMLVPEGYIALLTERRPEALALLAYYAVLLHYGRDRWQVNDAGVYLFNLIEAILGKEWELWVKKPREMMMDW
jgi:hypothetical protein